MVVASFLTFLSVSILVIVTPGPDTAVTISGTLGGGRSGGVFTALGVFCGQALWTVATSAGISALLVASEPAFLTVKYLGAAYLLYLGLRAIWSAVRHEPTAHVTAGESARPRSTWAYYRRGLLSDLGNPKMAVFFTSLLPQFGSRFVVLLLLGLVFCTMTFVWLACYAVVVAKMGNLLRLSSIRRALDAATGTVLAGLGIRLATDHR